MRGGFLLMAIVGVAAALVLTPRTARLRFRPEPGTSMRFEQHLEIDQEIARGGSTVAARGTWDWTLERTVASVDGGDVVVQDRFRNPTGNLRVLGPSASGYQDEVRALESRLAVATLEDRLVDTGRTGRRADDSALNELAPYPAAFRIILQKLHFPPHTVRVGDAWVTPLSDVRSLTLTLVGFEDRLGLSCARVGVATGRTFGEVDANASSAGTQELTEAKGTAWFARDTGWLVEAELEIDDSFSTVVGSPASEETHIRARHRWLGSGADASAGPAGG